MPLRNFWAGPSVMWLPLSESIMNRVKSVQYFTWTLNSGISSSLTDCLCLSTHLVLSMATSARLCTCMKAIPCANTCLAENWRVNDGSQKQMCRLLKEWILQQAGIRTIRRWRTKIKVLRIAWRHLVSGKMSIREVRTGSGAAPLAGWRVYSKEDYKPSWGRLLFFIPWPQGGDAHNSLHMHEGEGPHAMGSQKWN